MWVVRFLFSIYSKILCTYLEEAPNLKHALSSFISLHLLLGKIYSKFTFKISPAFPVVSEHFSYMIYEYKIKCRTNFCPEISFYRRTCFKRISSLLIYFVSCMKRGVWRVRLMQLIYIFHISLHFLLTSSAFSVVSTHFSCILFEDEVKNHIMLCSKYTFYLKGSHFTLLG